MATTEIIATTAGMESCFFIAEPPGILYAALREPRHVAICNEIRNDLVATLRTIVGIYHRSRIGAPFAPVGVIAGNDNLALCARKEAEETASTRNIAAPPLQTLGVAVAVTHVE